MMARGLTSFPRIALPLVSSCIVVALCELGQKDRQDNKCLIQSVVDSDDANDYGSSAPAHPLLPVDDAVSLLQSTTFVRQGKLAGNAARARAGKKERTIAQRQAPTLVASTAQSAGSLWFGQGLDSFTSAARDYQKWGALAMSALVLGLFLCSAANASKAMLKRLRSQGKHSELSVSEFASAQRLLLQPQQFSSSSSSSSSSSPAASQTKLSSKFALNQLLDHVGVDIKMSGRANGPAFVATLVEAENEGRTLQLASAVQPTRELMSVGPMARCGRDEGAAVYRFSTGCTIGSLKHERPGCWSLSKNDDVSLQIASPAPFTLTITMNGHEVARVKPASHEDEAHNPHEVGKAMCELVVIEDGDPVVVVSCALAALIMSCCPGDEAQQ